MTIHAEIKILEDTLFRLKGKIGDGQSKAASALQDIIDYPISEGNREAANMKLIAIGAIYWSGK